MIVKLSDVVDKISGNEDRFTTELEFYLGGEHYESERIAIYKKGIIKEDINILGFKFHFPFRAGDTIFMSRNPHLKKAGLVTFDGICSDTSYILRTKNQGVLLGRFLPLVLQNDRFWRWFEEHKSGSVNFLLNWKTLKEYEFDLPPIEEQERIANLAWAIEDTRIAYERMLQASDELAKSQFIELFGDLLNRRRPLSEVCTKGPQNGFYRKGSEINGDIAIIKMKQLFGCTAVGEAEDCDYVKLTENELNRFLLTEDDLVFGRRSLVIEGAGKCRRVGTLAKAMTFESSLLRITLDSKIVRPRYLQYWFDSDEGLKSMATIRSVTTIAGIKGSDLAKIMVPVPPISLQDDFLRILKQLDKSKFELEQALSELTLTYKRILAENLG